MPCVYPPIQVFVDLVREKAKTGMRVAEVGCFDGSTSLHFLPIIEENKGEAFLIDWFQGEANIGINRSHQFPHGYSEDPEPVYQSLLENISPFTCVKVLKGRSVDMAQHIPDNSLDICFIDADHKYEPVKMDIKAYLPKVKSGGIICGHDCDGWKWRGQFHPSQINLHYINMTAFEGCHPGVVQAVYDMFGDDIEVRPDPGPHKIPIWIKTV